jgi:hypothetical protein
VKHPVIDPDARFVPGPEWRWRIVLCPWCGAYEYWDEAELEDHGKCRNDYEPCAACVPQPLIWADAIGVA